MKNKKYPNYYNKRKKNKIKILGNNIVAFLKIVWIYKIHNAKLYEWIYYIWLFFMKYYI
jgi:hypothetical protein